LRETVFKFRLRLPSAEARDQYDAVVEEMRLMPGVTRVEGSPQVGYVNLDVMVEFEGPDDAKRLHRKIMKALMARKQLSIGSTTTTLTDIF
jgi:hypothetical protein